MPEQTRTFKTTLPFPLFSNTSMVHKLLRNTRSPARVAQLAGALSHTPKTVGLIPSQGTNLGCRFDPQLECVWEVPN